MDRLDGCVERWGKALADTNGSPPGEIYDDFCWSLATATRDELKRFCKAYGWEFDKVPAPLAVLAARLLANLSKDDPDALLMCRGVIRYYCDPIEEQIALAGFPS